jgi:hypothetical protein
MQLIRKLFRIRAQGGRSHKLRGLSTAELVGIIIIVGILGAVGGTYIGSLVNSATTNTIAQNVNSLNTVCASMLSGGVPVTTDGAGNVTNVNGTAIATPSDLLNLINSGVTLNGVTYQMNPQISKASIAAGTYLATAAPAAAGPASAISWAQAAGVTTP